MNILTSSSPQPPRMLPRLLLTQHKDLWGLWRHYLTEVFSCINVYPLKDVSGGCNTATPERDERDHSGDVLHQVGEARNQTSSPVSPTEVEEGTRTSPGTARGEGRQNTPMHVQGQGTGDHRVTLPYLSSEVAALGIYQPKAKYSYTGTALGSNQPELTLKTNLSPEGETLGAYQPKANSSQRGPICGVNQPELTHKANLSPEGN